MACCFVASGGRRAISDAAMALGVDFEMSRAAPADDNNADAAAVSSISAALRFGCRCVAADFLRDGIEKELVDMLLVALPRSLVATTHYSIFWVPSGEA